MAEMTLPLGSSWRSFFFATMPPAAWKSAKAPATSPSFDFNSRKSTFLEVLREPFGIVAVVVFGKLADAPSGILSEGGDFVESSEETAFFPDALAVGIG